MLTGTVKVTPRKPDKHPSSRFKAKASSRSDGQRRPSLSFLFVVNELIIESPESDEYHNLIPPQHALHYSAEIPSSVMRYCDGNVSLAAGYFWTRNGDHTPGYVWYCQPDGTPWLNERGGIWQPECYSTWSVFACNPLLPIMVANADPYVHNTSPEWRLLQIFHPPHLPGVSQVVTEESYMGPGGGPVRYAAGRNPSWIPSLVPETYRNPYQHASRPSTGLGGELPIILGLMALSESRDPVNLTNRTNEIFLGNNGHRGRWRNGEWRHEQPPVGYPQSAQDNPRGFVVSVFFDPNNPDGSSLERMRAFEWSDVVVRETHRGQH